MVGAAVHLARRGSRSHRLRKAAAPHIESNLAPAPPPPQGFVNSIVLLLYQKLEGQLQQMWEMVVQQPLAANGMQLDAQSGLAPGAAPPAGAGGDGSFVGGRSLVEGGGGGGGSFVHGDGSSAAVGKKMFSKRSCTEAMLKVLQHEIRKTHARTQNIE